MSSSTANTASTRSDYRLARALVRRTLTETVLAYGGRTPRSLDWLQMLSQLTQQPIGADSVIGIEPLPKELGTYEYEISLDVTESGDIHRRRCRGV